MPGGVHLVGATFALIAVGYALAVPPWNHPDEPAHFNYVRYLATRGELPVLEMGAWNTEELEALKASKFRGAPSIEHITYEAHQPPLYYVLAAPVYRLSSGLPLGGQVFALRLLSVGLGVALVYLVAVVALRAAPRRGDVATLAAGLAAFLPMHTSMAAAINSDALANVLGAGLVLAALRGVDPGYGRRAWAGVGALVGAALLTKATTYALIPLSVGALILGRRTSGMATWRDRLRDGALAGGVALVVSGWWFGRNGTTYGWDDLLASRRHDDVVVGQLRMADVGGEAAGGMVTTLWQSFWGVFGWMGVPMDDQMYLAYGTAVVVAGIGGVVALPYARQARRWGRLVILLGAGVAVAGALVLYNLRFVQPQGRYLFPALAAVAPLVAWGWAALWGAGDRPRWGTWAGAALVFGVVGLVAAEATTAMVQGLPRRMLYPGVALIALALSLLVHRSSRTVSSWVTPAVVVAGLAWADLAILLGVVAPAFR